MPESTDTVSIAVLVRDVTGEHAADRRRDLAEAVTRAPVADLLVLPYLAVHPAFWRTLDRAGGFCHAERPPYPSLLATQAAARESGQRVLASVYEALGEGVFYALAQVSEPGGEVTCTYRQSHALNQPGHYERLYMQPGSGETPPVFDCAGLRIGILMGGDLWAPEAARLLRLAGAELLLALSAGPAERPGEAQPLAAARSIEDGVPVLLTERGAAPRVFGAGASATDTPDDSEWRTVVLAPHAIRNALRRDDPLMTRRPRLYAPLARRWEEGGS